MKTTSLCAALLLLWMSFVLAEEPRTLAVRQGEEKKALPALRRLPVPAGGDTLRLATLAPARNVYVNAIAFSPAANLLAVGAKERIALFDLTTGREVDSLPGYNANLGSRTLSFSPDGKLLAAADLRGEISIINVASGRVEEKLKTPGIAFQLAFSSDGSKLTALQSPTKGPFRFIATSWRTRSWAPTKLVDEPSLRKLVQLSPNGNLLAISQKKFTEARDYKSSIVVWDLVRGKKTVLDPKLDNNSLCFTPDDRALLVGHDLGAFATEGSELWRVDLATGESKRLHTFKRQLQGMQISPDGKFLLASFSGGSGPFSELLDFDTFRSRWAANQFLGAFFTFSPGGEVLAQVSGMYIPLYALEDLLSERWAGMGSAIADAIDKGVHVDCSRDQVHVKLRGVPGSLGSLVKIKSLPCITHLDLIDREASAADLAVLKDLPDLAELNLARARGLDDNALAALEGVKSLRRLNLSGQKKLKGTGLAGLKNLQKLEELILNDCTGLDQTELKHLAGLKDLRVLDLRFAGDLTDEGLSFLSSLEQLRELRLASSKTTDKSLQRLKGLKQLEKLELRGMKLLDDLSFLSGLENLQELAFEASRVSDASLAHLKGLTKLKALDLRVTSPLTGAGLEHLRGLTSLESLNLNGVKMTDETMSHLKHFTKLRSLSLYAVPVTDAGLEPLAGLAELEKIVLPHTTLRGPGLRHLKNVTELDLSLTRIDDEGMQGVKDLRKLRRLVLPYAVTDAGLVNLAGLESLEELFVPGARTITGKGLIHLKKLPRLWRLQVERCQIDEEGLAAIKELKKLEALDLTGSRLTETGLVHLEAMTHLRQLTLPAKEISDARYESLRKKMPKTVMSLSSR